MIGGAAAASTGRFEAPGPAWAIGVVVRGRLAGQDRACVRLTVCSACDAVCGVLDVLLQRRGVAGQQRLEAAVEVEGDRERDEGDHDARGEAGRAARAPAGGWPSRWPPSAISSIGPAQPAP